jgi:hypothetical protein
MIFSLFAVVSCPENSPSKGELVTVNVLSLRHALARLHLFSDWSLSIICNRCSGSIAAANGSSDGTKSESNQHICSATSSANSSLSSAEL